MKRSFTLILIFAYLFTSVSQQAPGLNGSSSSGILALRPVASGVKDTFTGQTAAVQDTVVQKFPAKNKAAWLTEIIIAVSIISTLCIVSHYFYAYYMSLRKMFLPLADLLSAFISFTLGDYLRQRIARLRGFQQDIDKRHLLRYMLVFTIFGGLNSGYLWHELSLMENNTQKAIKIAMDQLILSPLYFIPLILTIGRWLVEKRPFKEALEDSARRFLSTYTAALTYCTTILILSYFVVSTETPFLAICIFTTVWAVILSFIVSNEDGQKEGMLKRNLNIYTSLSPLWLSAFISVTIIFPSGGMIALAAMASILWLFIYYKYQNMLEKLEAQKAAGKKPVRAQEAPKTRPFSTILEAVLRQGSKDQIPAAVTTRMPGIVPAARKIDPQGIIFGIQQAA